jgi:hypothetical protein
MNKTFLKVGLGLLAVVGAAWPSSGAVTEMKTLHGHVPAIVSKLSPTGTVNNTNTLHLAIGLPLHNQDQLNALLQQVSDPSSRNYRHYLTPDQFTSQFGATDQDIQSIIGFAQANGLTVTRVHSNHMLVEVDGKASDVEHAFNVTLHTYHLAAENRNFYAPDQEPSVPATLPALDVQGLNSYAQPHSRLHFAPQKSSSTKLGSGPFGTYMGYDFRNAYVPGTPLNGAGQSVALVEFDGYVSNDITLYEQRAGLPAASLTNVLLRGFSGTPFDPNAQGEVTLDIDMVIAMAPGISQVMVYEDNPLANFNPNIVLNRIATDNSARQVSSSWGWTGGPSATTDQIFQQMILQGQSYFNASGDSCAFLPPGSPGSVDDPTFFGAPSDSPYITQVGATTLQTTGPGGSFLSESVWNWGLEFPGQGYDGVGSSGGISGFYPIPTWQQGISMANNQGSTTMRNLPDVGLTGDNIFIIVNGVDEDGVGGTSCAAPLWAGFIALVNQQATNNGAPMVGFLNPAIYALAKTANYTNYFRDVVQGNNTWSQSPTEFFAVSGFDLCTGLGSPNGTNLINALASGLTNLVPVEPIFPAPLQPWGNTLSVMDGANPNGLWFLFIQDDLKNNAGGVLNNGWAVNLTTANPVGYAGDNELYVNTTVNGQSYGNATNVPAAPGALWQITMAVTNYGPSLSSNVFVSETLPTYPDVTLVSSNSSIPGSSIDVVGSTLIWHAGNLGVNAGGTVTLNFQVNNTGSFSSAATVIAATTDPNPDDDSVMVTANVAVATPPTLVPKLVGGGNGEFHLTVSNNAGSTTVIQASTNLVTWLPVYTNISPFTFTNYDVTNFSKRFYRAVQ